MSDQPDQPTADQPSLNRRSLSLGSLVAALILLMLFGIGIWVRVVRHKKLQADQQAQARITVNFVKVTRDRHPQELVLPGNIQAFEEATLYARANGYVKRWLVDIGDKVQSNQLLAEIETPELDQQVAQARASLQQAAANLGLAKSSAARYQDAVTNNAVSVQSNDEQQSNYKAREADYAAGQANVNQLVKLQDFKRVIAPFAGTITSRRIDIGSLISTGSTVLFTLAQSDPLRIYVDVPQSNVPALHEGVPVKIIVKEYPGRDFAGQVVRLAGALDPMTRTMMIEIQIPNHDGTLYAGMYAQIKFTLSPPNPPIVIPASAFVFRAQGSQVAMLTSDNRVHWQNIQVGLDFGTYLEIVEGLKENDSVIANPSDLLEEGMQVLAKQVDAPKPIPQTSSTGD